MPGLFLLSLALASLRFRFGGHLAFPIGLHTGMVAGNQLFNAYGMAHRCSEGAPGWVSGVGATYNNPLAGVVAIVLLSCIVFAAYPRAAAKHSSEDGHQSDDDSDDEVSDDEWKK